MRFSPFSIILLFGGFITSSLASFAATVSNTYGGTFASVTINYDVTTQMLHYRWETGGQTANYWSPGAWLYKTTGPGGPYGERIFDFAPQLATTQSMDIPVPAGTWVRMGARVLQFTTMNPADSLLLNPDQVLYFQLGTKEDQQPVYSLTASPTVTLGDTYTPSSDGGNGTGDYFYLLGPGYSTAVPVGDGIPTTAVGTVHYKVMRAGDANYNDSPLSGEYTLTVQKGAQSAPQWSPNSLTIGEGSSFALPSPAADSQTHGDLIWSIDSQSVPTAAISGGNLNYSGLGYVVLKAKYAATSQLNESSLSTFTIQVNSSRNRTTIINDLSFLKTKPKQQDDRVPFPEAAVSDIPQSDHYVLKLRNPAANTHAMELSATIVNGNIRDGANLSPATSRTIPSGGHTTLDVYVPKDGKAHEVKMKLNVNGHRQYKTISVGP